MTVENEEIFDCDNSPNDHELAETVEKELEIGELQIENELLLFENERLLQENERLQQKKERTLQENEELKKREDTIFNLGKFNGKKFSNGIACKCPKTVK